MMDHTLHTSDGFTQSHKDQLLVMLSSRWGVQEPWWLVLGWVMTLTLNLRLTQVLHFQQVGDIRDCDRVSANTPQLPRRASSNSALNHPFTPLGCLFSCKTTSFGQWSPVQE